MLVRAKQSMSFEEEWRSLRPTLLKLLTQSSVNRAEWQDAFWSVYLVCMWDERGAIKIFNAIREDVRQWVEGVGELVSRLQEEKVFLKCYVDEWRKFFTQCAFTPLPFEMLDPSLYSSDGATTTPRSGVSDNVVRRLLFDSWRQSVFSIVSSRLDAACARLVDQERVGDHFDSQLIVGVRQACIDLCSNGDDKFVLYRKHFEKAYIEAAERFYLARGDEYLDKHGVEGYMRWSENKLREEETRATKYLECSTGSVQKLLESLVKVLVTSHREVLQARCASLIAANDTSHLKLLFKLMDQADGVDPLLIDLETHIFSTGIEDMLSCAESLTHDSEKYVEKLLSLFHRFSLLVKEAFCDDHRFLTSRDKAYKKVVNDTSVFRLDLKNSTATTTNISKGYAPESRCPELLANYCDMLLRRTPFSRHLTSEESEKRLKDVLLVLKYVQNKDVFMRYTKAHLTRRLILGTSADMDREESMVEWLREVGMPADFINKLARMFQDIKISEDLNACFKEHFTSHKQPLADVLSIKILNQGAWARSYEKQNVSLPRELEDVIPEMEEFYKAKHSGRKLQWHHHLSNGTLSFTNASGCRFDIDVTTFQMAVLFVWQSRRNDRISFENLRLATELPDTELRRTLWSLVAMPKLKKQLLLYEPTVNRASEFGETTMFWINHNFATASKAPVKSGINNNNNNNSKQAQQRARGRVNLIGRLQLATEKSREEENAGIVRLRMLRTQEAIIKIMKMRRQVSNAQLQTELVDILKNMFLPSKKLIKEQIEWLIENNFMKRDESDINAFIYVA